ncbi:MAG: hypothetical protein ABIN37_02215 [Burkholderiaceae bacterium]
MDHTLYAYSALPRRAPQPFAPGPGLVAHVVLFLEHWELLPPEGALRDPRMVGEFGSFTPDYRSWTQHEYGLRVGIFRVIDALREAGIRPVIAANAMALQRLPRLVQLFTDWGCEWLGHGLAATRMVHARMGLEEQDAMLRESLDVLAQATGVQPMGWVSQDWGTTPDTASLLAGAGVRYTLDWCNDDQPFWMHTDPPLLAVPLSAEWDDVQCQWLRHVEPRAHAELAAGAFEQMHAECVQQQRNAVFGLALHPWVCGMPSRIAALRSLLQRLRASAGVHWLTPQQIFCNLRGDPARGLS